MNKEVLRKIGIGGLALAGLLGALYWRGARADVSFADAGADADLHGASTDNGSGASSNPYCGWYQINQYYLSETDFPDDAAIAESLDLNDGMRLSLAEYNLAEYADGALSERALAEIRTTFSIAQKQGVGLIARFLYDWNGNAASAEPGDRAVVEMHISQVAPLINEYADTIFCVQGLFIGDYGEMHDSAFANDADETALLQLLAEQVSPRIFLAVRTPEQWRTLTGVSNPSRSRQTALSGRTGLFNDGILADDTDFGTYAEGARAKELSFQNVLCQIVPNGGEVVGGSFVADGASAGGSIDGGSAFNDSSTGSSASGDLSAGGSTDSRSVFGNLNADHTSGGDLGDNISAGDMGSDNSLTDISTTINTLRTMRISYLNPEYDAAVIDRWKQTDYEGENAYDYIGAHLGYRYELTHCKGKTRHRFRDSFAPSVDLTITANNTGFAPAYRRFDAELVIAQDEAERLSLPIHMDNREWMPDAPVSVEARIPAKQIQKLAELASEKIPSQKAADKPIAADSSGDFVSANLLSVWLRLRDTASGAVIRFANRENDAELGVCLGTLSMQ